MNDEGLSYKQAGVDIDAATESVDMIKKWVNKTKRPEVLAEIGSFGGLFELSTKYKQPVLVSGTDGVGTKLKIAQMMGVHDTVGIDLVAMCVNDILVHGAEPLFFLDYISLGKLKPELVESLVKGISEGCIQAGCSLIGGETAEMPGFYNDDEYDLAGFAVGAVEKSRLITGNTIEDGDVIIGLPSSGIHSNGYSLARKVLLEKAGLKLDQHIESLGKTLGEELLTPTNIYVKSILPLLENDIDIKGMAHITGGGIPENFERVLPEGLGAEIDSTAIPVLPIFELIQQQGQVKKEEMFRTFNMGVGFLITIPALHRDKALKHLRDKAEKPIVLGRINSQIEGVVIE
ncbi:Phosphoribosylformylglycinamidine cyclo-ligase [Candidatus Syntrophocurvum alkaliphilum]|uniref:Phosphoribosylformylglycinamidine cyclo-ligase n=1 Tax=Candidatus Syntrophocurvum alkaliphilum TaxID=2293317 RepID=A0A6I6DGN5_9FIRM|nr:phosphoribosylformylglycinamidine cyclo-ligase [Candidatus Syntrophocurvum alkaliphilum]QGT98809.1 Phosphoribosylformylglycinamidine cyclo-ligase [Candidatus Syntrophocurvum alkaliphilum]